MDQLANAIDSEYNYLWYCRATDAFYATKTKGNTSYGEVGAFICGMHILERASQYAKSDRFDPIELNTYRNENSV